MALPWLQAKNNVVLKLAAPLLAEDSTMEVVDASTAPPLFPYQLVVNNKEIVQVIGADGNTLNIERNQEDTQAADLVAAGKKATLNITAAYIQEVQGYIEALFIFDAGIDITTSDYVMDSPVATILVDASSGNRTVTLNAAFADSLVFTISIKKIDQSAHTVTITVGRPGDPVGTIDGEASYVLELPGEFVMIALNGINGYVVAE